MAFRSSASLDEERLLGEEKFEPPKGKDKRTYKTLLPYSLILNCILVIGIIGYSLMPAKAYIPNEIYSPARSAVEYKTVVFKGGLKGDKSEYQGSSKDVDAKWEDLYNEVGLSQIPASSAAKLPNATTPLAGDTSQYMVELDVFHQLHCLNMMRKLVYPDVYKTDLKPGSEVADDNIYHMEHCYEQLRQSIQCSSDISTIYWEWSPEKNKNFGNLKTTHTCRDFEKIRAWAVQHKLTEDYDMYTHVPGAPIRHN